MSVENSITSFERSRKEEKNYMKGSNRFCAQTRLEKRTIIVITEPSLSSDIIRVINPNLNCIPTVYQFFLEFSTRVTNPKPN